MSKDAYDYNHDGGVLKDLWWLCRSAFKCAYYLRWLLAVIILCCLFVRY